MKSACDACLMGAHHVPHRNCLFNRYHDDRVEKSRGWSTSEEAEKPCTYMTEDNEYRRAEQSDQHSYGAWSACFRCKVRRVECTYFVALYFTIPLKSTKHVCKTQSGLKLKPCDVLQGVHLHYEFFATPTFAGYTDISRLREVVSILKYIPVLLCR